MSDKKGISRRQFLAGAAVTVAASSVPVLTNVTPAMAASPMVALVPGDPSWTPLNATALARQGYEIYKGKHTGQSACCEGTFWPVIGELGNRYPATWGTFPKGVFNFGGAGVNAWRAMCGATNAGPAVLKLVTNNSNAIDTFLRWYETEKLPSGACRADYEFAIANPTDGTRWIPGGTTAGVWGGTGLPIPFQTNPSNAAGSVLCHASLTAWRVAGGNFEALNSGAQSDRCGKIVYDSVYKIATIINSFMAGGTFTASYAPSVASCGEATGAACHGTVNAKPLAQAKMDCIPCHE